MKEIDALVDSETVCLWLVDHRFDRVIKTLCCMSIAKGRFQNWIEIQ